MDRRRERKRMDEAAAMFADKLYRQMLQHGRSKHTAGDHSMRIIVVMGLLCTQAFCQYVLAFCPCVLAYLVVC